MKFLLDANCWMQRIRAREHADEVRDLIQAAGAANILLTEFSLYSIALVMRRHNMLPHFPQFLQQSGIGQDVELVRLMPTELVRVVDSSPPTTTAAR